MMDALKAAMVHATMGLTASSNNECRQDGGLTLFSQLEFYSVTQDSTELNEEREWRNKRLS
jgi:hypothetical protein